MLQVTESLGHLLRVSLQPRDAIFSQLVEGTVNARGPLKRFSCDLFEVTLAVASIPAEFLRYWIPAVAESGVIRPGFVDAVSFIGVKAECDAHRLAFGESALALLDPLSLFGVVSDRMTVWFPGKLLLNPLLNRPRFEFERTPMLTGVLRQSSSRAQFIT
jgi:hypothetical protein